MRYRKIKNNFNCIRCGIEGFYSPEYLRTHVYCEDCKPYRGFLGKIFERIILFIAYGYV